MSGRHAPSSGASSRDEVGGERVLPVSRRPDGTLRKEVRVRAGYVPQDEVDRYQARGTRPKQSGPQLPPGMDPAHLQQKKKSGGNKKKGEGKKNGDAQTSGSIQHQVAPSSNGEKASTASSTHGGTQANESQSAASSHAGGTTGEEAAGNGGAQEPEKKVRALRKKIRQAEALAESLGGKSPTPEEEEKIGKILGWKEEVEELERRIFAALQL